MTTFAWPLAPIRTSGAASAIVAFSIAGEPRHLRMPRRREALGRDDLAGGEPEDLQVERERAMVHVPDVQAQALLPGLRVAPVDLRPAGHAGPHLVLVRLLGGIERQVF